MHYAILGNGVAGMEAALGLRRLEPSARISLVSDEHDHFYSRPALMYVLCGQLDLRGTEPYDRRFYEKMRFERVRGRVSALDTAGRALAFEDGRTLGYDRLLLAVGSRARPGAWPGTGGPGVHAFVTLRDLEALDREAGPGRRAVVIGGGLIGVEVAEVLLRRGLSVAFVIREDWYFPMALDAQESRIVAEHMRAHGCDVRLGASVSRIARETSGVVRAVVLEGGAEVPCDLVVVAIGVVPSTGFLAASGLRLSPGGAIEVDEALRTSAPDVWAAGDCANVAWSDGTRRPEQLWYTARDQGRVAARSMAGEDVTYRRGTWYNSAKFFDLEWTTAGWVPALLNWDNTPLDPGPGYRSWFQRVPGRAVSQRIVTKDDRVTGFNLLGSRWNQEPLLEWIEAGRSLDWVLAHLHEAQFDEELSEPFRVLPHATVS
ncbi:MAG TPA: NAD(P)/FAD-dependent oxidoreductase [Vicinamibacteria bacterium]|nr:NAD(P)/FAD-dependent oxidoreductase [Vicinamibacteria bacterium]